MLRLKPSEITLTPADVEETRRRMERRQAVHPPATLPRRIRGPRVPLGVSPRLRRGPQRSRDEAVASLGTIPILRPRQVVHASADDTDDADDDDVLPRRDSATDDFEERVANNPLTTPPPVHRTPTGLSPTSPRLAVPLPAGNLQLPFRPAPPRGDTSLNDTEEAVTPTSKQHLTLPRFGRPRTNSSGEGNERPSHLRIHAATDGTAEPADTQETPVRTRARILRQHSIHAPSPLQQMHTLSSPLRRRAEENGAQDPNISAEGGDDSPTRYLQGYFAGHRYTFREYIPHTEPRMRTQPAQRPRSMSSNSEPSYSTYVQRPIQSTSSSEDVFWNPLAPEPPTLPASDTRADVDSSHDRYWTPLGSVGMGLLNATRPNAHRISSDASTASLAYSFYELPDSRQSSSDQLQGGSLGQSQYDGTASSRHVSRGAYYSIRPSQVRAVNESKLRPPPPARVPSLSSPDLTTLGQNNVSPLPANPYTRGASGQHFPRLSAGLITSADLVDADRDASRAVERDLSSPLDLIEQRATSYLTRISAARQEGPSYSSSGNPYASQHRAREWEEPTARHRQLSGSESLQQHLGNRIQGRGSAGNFSGGRRTLQPPRAHTGQVNARDREMQSYRRNAPAARAEQRSSENMPMATSSHEGHHHHAAQAQAQRGNLALRPNPPSSGAGMRGGEFLLPSAPFRSTMAQTARPRDMSNRPHLQYPYPRFLPDDNDNERIATLSPVRRPRRSPQALLPGSLQLPRIPPRYPSHHQPIDIRRPQPARLAAPFPQSDRQEAVPPFNRYPQRGPPSTSTTLDIANGITSRRPPPHLFRAPPRRRIPAHQVDQENSGGAEVQQMRQELGVVGVRYGEDDGQLDTMDETPPRMGRFERRMGS